MHCTAPRMPCIQAVPWHAAVGQQARGGGHGRLLSLLRPPHSRAPLHPGTPARRGSTALSRRRRPGMPSPPAAPPGRVSGSIGTHRPLLRGTALLAPMHAPPPRETAPCRPCRPRPRRCPPGCSTGTCACPAPAPSPCTPGTAPGGCRGGLPHAAAPPAGKGRPRAAAGKLHHVARVPRASLLRLHSPGRGRILRPARRRCAWHACTHAALLRQPSEAGQRRVPPFQEGQAPDAGDPGSVVSRLLRKAHAVPLPKKVHLLLLHQVPLPPPPAGGGVGRAALHPPGGVAAEAAAAQQPSLGPAVAPRPAACLMAAGKSRLFCRPGLPHQRRRLQGCHAGCCPEAAAGGLPGPRAA